MRLSPMLSCWRQYVKLGDVCVLCGFVCCVSVLCLCCVSRALRLCHVGVMLCNDYDADGIRPQPSEGMAGDDWGGTQHIYNFTQL